MKESSLQASILKRLRERGCYAVKYPAGPYSRAGVPDILACIAKDGKGLFVGIEVKSPTGKLTNLQKKEIEDIVDARGRATVIRSMEELERFLELCS